MIPLKDCKHGWTYQLSSRNLIIGVFNERTKGFVGLRDKFRSLFLFTELHRDVGAPHGTATPVSELEQCPVGDLRESFDVICFDCKGMVHWLENEAKYGKGKGDWQHVGEPPPGCKKIVTGSGRWGAPKNTELFDYLKNIEDRYSSK